jgi:hypothetical protein
MIIALLAALAMGLATPGSIEPSPAPAPEAIQEVSPFHGTWILNQAESDNPMEMAARGRINRAPPQGQEMTEAQKQEAMEIVRAEMGVVELLILDEKDGWVTMNTKGGGIAMFNGDGQDIKMAIAGVPYEVRTEIDDDRISIRRRWEKLQFRDEYRLEDDGARLVLKRWFRGGPIPQFEVKFVYDRQVEGS